MRRSLFLTVAMLVVATGGTSLAQLPLLAQDRDNAPARLLSGAENAALGDPFFTLVLRDHTDATTLDQLEEHLAPGASQLFVVDENIANPTLGQSRRAVVTYTGTTDGEVLDSNIFLSLFFDSSSFAQGVINIEVMAWDAHRGRYNYYKLDRTGTPQLQPSWKFRGSSDGADVLNPNERQGTCMACHITGSPIMKELPLPWNNWHSFRSGNTSNHLRPGNPESWPVSSETRLARLAGAERLETEFVIPAVTQFSHRRVLATLQRSEITGDVDVNAQGFATMVEARRILRHLFEAVEFNITSSNTESGLHPLGVDADAGPAANVRVPAAFFLDRHLLTGGGIRNYRGLGLSEAAAFETMVEITPTEYRALVRNAGVRLAGRPGDAHFAWLTPESSHVDGSVVDRLMRVGALTREFVAAVKAVDLRNPVVSSERAALLAFVPSTYEFRWFPTGNGAVAGRHPDPLALAVIERIRATTPASGSAAALLLERLEAADPVALLREDVEAYRLEIASALAGPGRAVELERLHNQLLRLRREVLGHPVLGVINETGNRLFPLP